ncbi:MAG: phosphate acyltransferase PlsX [Bacillota bacterium]|nr:phosphate acyltransferase PlsX [Bacillota bacterium]
MKIAVDVMGGDHAPAEIIQGALNAVEANKGLEIVLVGNEEAIRTHAPQLPQRVEAVFSETVMAMDEAVENLRRKKDSSIYVATSLVKEGKAEAVVSAGSTGAQMAAAILLLGRIKGVKRPAIVIPYPTLDGDKVMLDGGANPDATAENLVDFAILGNAYAKSLLGMDEPRVALLSNGTESHKGTAAVIEAHKIMAEAKTFSFIGNVEGRDMMKGNYDVVVCDGFSGNIVLKLTEGVAAGLFSLIKKEITATPVRKLGAALVKPGLSNLKKLFDYSAYGGAPLLGVKGVSMVCHGSSKALAIENAITGAVSCVEHGFIEALAQDVAAYKGSTNKTKEVAANESDPGENN